jgi:alkylhydroperoxidase/carboxymuconolactone decarboxylase family protein YurZ
MNDEPTRSGSQTPPSDPAELDAIIASFYPGYPVPHFDLSEMDPAFNLIRKQLQVAAFAPVAPALPVKYRELIAAVVLAARGHPTIGKHLRRAIREGLTMQELVEAFHVAFLPGGGQLFSFAMQHLAEIASEMREAESTA